MKSLITVIIPVYNKQKRLSIAVDSVLRNKVQCEILIVDDGSTDKSGKIADIYANKYKNIKVIHQKNQWVYAAFNNGIKEATGEYIYILNADDELQDKCIDKMIALVNKYNYPDVIWTRCQMLVGGDVDKCWQVLEMDSGNIEECYYPNNDDLKKNWSYLFENRFVENQANLYKRELAIKHPFRNDVYAADGLFNIQIADDIKSAVVMKDYVYKYYRYADINENISNGKFYSYQHDMNNELFYGHKKILSDANIYKENQIILAKWRLLEFMSELNMLRSKECRYSIEKKLNCIFDKYIDEPISESIKILNAEKEYEARMLFVIREILLKENISTESEYYFAYNLIASLYTFNKNDDDLDMLYSAVNNHLNTFSLGMEFYKELTT